MQHSSLKHPHIAVAGVMGSGKTTVCKLLAKTLKLHLIEERPKKNIFLKRFYRHPKKWAFHTQLFYLKERSTQLLKIERLLKKTGVVHDSPIYQDCFTYAHAQYALGNMNKKEFLLYKESFLNLTKNLPSPHLIIQLDASPDIIKNRISGRGRKYEKNVSKEYLKLLLKLQEKWLKNIPPQRKMRVNTDRLNLTYNHAHQQEFINTVKIMLPKMLTADDDCCTNLNLP